MNTAHNPEYERAFAEVERLGARIAELEGALQSRDTELLHCRDLASRTEDYEKALRIALDALANYEAEAGNPKGFARLYGEAALAKGQP